MKDLCRFLFALFLFSNSVFVSGQEVEAKAKPDWFRSSGSAGGWREVSLDGATECALGGDYSFYVRRGTENKLLIFFEGGGFIYNKESCENYYVRGKTQINTTIGDLDGRRGIFDFSNSNNPFSAYHFVYLPYCTGDLHWGNADHDYGCPEASPETIHHRGFINARAALDTVFSVLPSQPSVILVTGCSAGGLGSIFHVPYVIDRYPNSIVSQLSDCAAGVVPYPCFWCETNSNWGVFDNLPPWLMSTFTHSFDVSDLYITIAKHYPDNIFSQFNYILDVNQANHYQELGGRLEDFIWSQMASLSRIHAEVPNFRSFTVSGSVPQIGSTGISPKNHCILGMNKFYELEINIYFGGPGSGVHSIKLVDWVKLLAEQPQKAPNIYVDHAPLEAL